MSKLSEAEREYLPGGPRAAVGADKPKAPLSYPQDIISGFAQGARLDLRVRFAMQLLGSPLFEGLGLKADELALVKLDPMVVSAAEMLAHRALDIATALLDEAEARGLVTPIVPGEELDERTIEHLKRNGAAQVHQQAGANKAAQEAQGRINVAR